MSRRSDVVCRNCGKTENLPNSRAINYKYCSKECMSVAFLNRRIPNIGEKINNWTVVDSAILRKHGRAYIKVRCSCDNKTEFDLPYSHLDSKKSVGCKKCSRFHTSKGYKLITGTFWSLIESGAKKRNIDFSVSIQEAWDLYEKQNGVCALSGLSIHFEPSTGKHETLRTCSLDRKDSKKGYTLDNIQWVHKDINIMKNKFNEEYFKSMIKSIISNNKLDVKVKRLSQDSVLPTYAKHGDAGMDLTATSKEYDEYGNVVYGTGLAFEIPFGYVGLLFPRSSNSKKDLLLSNAVGVLDSGYRGEVFFKFKPSVVYADYTKKDWSDFISSSDFIAIPSMDYSTDITNDDYNIGDRIGQIIIMPIPQVQFIEVDELSDSERGNGGFGSTGK